MAATHREMALGIMARYPRPCDTKTRLAADLGAEPATEVYGICAQSLFREMCGVPASINKYIFIAGNKDWDEVRNWTGQGFNLSPQAGDDLGKRLVRAFSRMFSTGARMALLIASDVPDISVAVIDEAFSALESYDIVLGPSHDGGYYLIGLNQLKRQLFKGMEWGTDQVLEDTIAIAEESGLSWYLLPTLIDIDSISDLRLWLAMGTGSHQLREYIRSANPELFGRAVDYQI